MSQYLDVFLDESKEHLDNLNKCLLELEKNSADLAVLNEIFRSAHTLKGMSSTMGFEDLADLTHHMENILSDLKEGNLEITPPIVDTLFKCLDRLQYIVEKIEAGDTTVTDNSDLILLLGQVNEEKISLSADQSLQEETQSNENSVNIIFNDYDITVFKEAKSRNYKIFQIDLEIDEQCLMKSVRVFMVFKSLEEYGEIIKSFPEAQDLEEGKFENDFSIVYITSTTKNEIINKLNSISEIKLISIEEIEVDNLSQPTTPSEEILTHDTFAGSENQSNDNDIIKKSHKIKQTIRVDIDRLDKLMNLVGELVMHKGRLEQIGTIQKTGELNEVIEEINRVSSDLQSIVMQVRMVPIEQVFNRFPRMVRDLAKELNKEVDFIIEGKETELDRTVIDEIGDPLVHLLRNSLDHGLELAEQRLKNGKNEQGKLFLRARHEGNNVYIEVEDDGAGISTQRIAAKAMEKGLINEDDLSTFNMDEAIKLLFSSGFSTAEDITDISGRGVGLDVVKNKIESLNGEIMVQSKPNLGTKFQIKLPLTLAIIQALMVSIEDEIYAIPLSSVVETTIINQNAIKSIQQQEVMTLRGSVLPLFRLSKLLSYPGANNDHEDMYIVVVRKTDKQIGIIVDKLIGQQEIVIKSMGKILSGIPGIAGAIVAGDGNVRLILDIATLFN